MAADYPKMIRELLAFYDLAGKTVLAVGGGGGQLIEYGRAAGRVLALDVDPAALDKLRENLRAARLEDKYEPVLGDFFKVELKADVVLFEFSLHEMADPGAAVERALRMAPDVVVYDHWPGSPWTFLAGEDLKVAASWAALGRFPGARMESHEGVQSFDEFGQLEEKVKHLGEPTLSRIAAFRGKTDIRIPMTYGLALIRRAETPP
jgi:SAM-dependent methyltransferase